VQKAETASGLLRVTAPVAIGRTLIAAWAQEFIARHPHVKLELSVTDRNVDLIHEGYDVAVRMGTLADTSLVGRALAHLPTVLVASPDYLARCGTPRVIDELRQHACLHYLLAGRPLPFLFANGTSLVGEGPLDTDDAGALRQAALSGAGITHLMRFVVAEELANGRLVQVLPEHELTPVPVHVLHAFGRRLPVRARLFVDFLVERVKGLA
jgi:DNA-binding transcriptional LysR family regulator